MTQQKKFWPESLPVTTCRQHHNTAQKSRVQCPLLLAVALQLALLPACLRSAFPGFARDGCNGKISVDFLLKAACIISNLDYLHLLMVLVLNFSDTKAIFQMRYFFSDAKLNFIFFLIFYTCKHKHCLLFATGRCHLEPTPIGLAFFKGGFT